MSLTRLSMIYCRLHTLQFKDTCVLCDKAPVVIFSLDASPHVSDEGRRNRPDELKRGLEQTQSNVECEDTHTKSISDRIT